MSFLALDVHYDDALGLAWAAAVRFMDWGDATAGSTHVVAVPLPHAYEPGSFYLRELPCLLALTRELGADVYIVDGYVDVAPGRPGLGRKLFDALGGRGTVVGVAKSRFVDTAAAPVRRGRSARPLWVTSTGDLAAATAGVAAMHGPDRRPTLLTLVDRLARDAAAFDETTRAAGARV